LDHTKCGAVTAACKNVELGNITTLLDKIKPTVTAINESSDKDIVTQIEEVTKKNH